MQATVKVTIRYCIWREGRPRFVPSKDLRKLGFAGKDLKHESGQWFTLEETKAWVDGELMARIQERKAQAAGGRRVNRDKRATIYSVADLFADMFKDDPKLKSDDAPLTPGRRLKRLAANTVRFYRGMANILQGFDEELWVAPARSISPVVAWGLYEKLAEAKGLHTARGVIAAARRAWSWGRRTGKVGENPFKDLGMEMPEGRVRAGTVAEVRHLVATCDAQGRFDVGDMIMLAVFTTQRQADRLAMTWKQIAGGRFFVEQNKTGAIISAPLPAVLLARLEAAKVRRHERNLQFRNVCIDERLNQPWNEHSYRHVFAELRALAAATMGSIADLRDQDLRDTGISWARDGGAAFDMRRLLSGHSAQSAELEEKHYLAATPSQGDAAAQAILKTWEKGE